MARARNLKPGFFTDAELLECPFWVRLLFQGLWIHADRRGILADNTKQIKIDVFPADDVDVEDGLSQLAQRGFIVRYEREGKRCIVIPAFEKHQSPHPKEPASTLPSFIECVEQVACNLQASDEPLSDQERARSVSLHSSSLHSSSLIADSGLSESEDAPAALAEPTFSSVFEVFWAEWLMGVTKGHGGKTPAYQAWKRLKLNTAGADETRERISAGLARWKSSAYWQQEGGRFVMKAERWLGEQKWNDDPPAVFNGAARASPQNGRVGADPRPMFDLAEQYRKQGI